MISLAMPLQMPTPSAHPGPDISLIQILAVVGLSLAGGAVLVWALMWVTKREAEFDAERAERRKRGKD